MKKYWNYYRIYITTLRKDLLGILIIAISSIFLMDMWFKNIPAPCNFFIVFGNFWYTLAFSYIASFIFYFIVVHIPRQKEKKAIYSYIESFVKNIIETGLEIYTHMAQSVSMDIDVMNISNEQIIQLCKVVNPQNDSPVLYEMSVSSRHLNWIEYLQYQYNRIKDFASTILLQTPFLDLDLISYIIKIESHNIYEPKHINLQLILINSGRFGNKDFTNGYENSFISFYKLLCETQEYFHNEILKYKD